MWLVNVSCSKVKALTSGTFKSEEMLDNANMLHFCQGLFIKTGYGCIYLQLFHIDVISLTFPSAVHMISGCAGQQGVAALFAFQSSGLFHTNDCSIFPDRVRLQPHLLIPSVCLCCWCRGAGWPLKLHYLLTSVDVLADLSFTLQMCGLFYF